MSLLRSATTFKRNEYAGYSSEDSGLEYDIPLRKLIVFAQGKNVKIGSLKNEEGGEVKLQSDTAVSYSSTDGAGLTTFVKSTPGQRYISERTGCGLCR